MALHQVSVYIESNQDPDEIADAVEKVLQDGGIEFRDIDLSTFNDEDL